MSTVRRKKFKRKVRKALYNILSALNEFDLKKLRPIFIMLAIAGLLTAAAKLPTPEENNASSLEAGYGSSLAYSIRAVSADYSTVAHQADVVCVFLPEHLANLSENEFLDTVSSKALYSFYLTGEELAYLAEGITSISTVENTLFLDGISYTYHQNRLPFGRLTDLTLASGAILVPDTIYHVVSTEEIFSLFHYISYRTLGIMTIYPKTVAGTPLSDYQEALLSENGEHLTIGSALSLTVDVTTGEPLPAVAVTSIVTELSGFNLIALINSPNKMTICAIVLLAALVALLWYIVPRLRRVCIWFRIYRIRSRKRSTHTIFLKKRSPLRRSDSYRRIE